MELLYLGRLAMAGYLGSDQLLPGRIRPRSATINLTTKCNSRCITCNYWRKPGEDLLDTKRVIDLLAEIHDLGVKYVMLSGGEPLLRKDLFDILGTLEPGHFSSICLATNALLLDKHYEKINNSVITHINVSIDAVGENNDRIRGVKGYYENAIQSLERIENKIIRIVSTMSSPLADDMEDLIRLCQERGYTYDVNLPDHNPPFFAGEDVKRELQQLWPNESEMEKMIQLLSKNKILSRRFLAGIKTYLVEKCLDISHCMLGYISVTIMADGSVNPACYVLPSCGNILHDKLRNLIQSKEYRQTVRKMYDLSCPRCTCGYGSSLHYEAPLGHLSHILNRLFRILRHSPGLFIL